MVVNKKNYEKIVLWRVAWIPAKNQMHTKLVIYINLSVFSI